MCYSRCNICNLIMTYTFSNPIFLRDMHAFHNYTHIEYNIQKYIHKC